ncbi:phage portal protein [Paraburkholderia sp. BL21I4N1]|uniref:phage portal protein n=1 Tax=Paraburkholderia sp. BL21I4N1 TaxID=1938801 RepID=UPI000CFD713E|nr:phage portal protein [Paraburkholderia sp. BL21I4N1]PQV50989.1 hypothetical protein B0G83_105352 [Paraburkholderia sp. BL21I4N1]
MSAHAYIQWADVPQQLIDTSRQHVDEITEAQIVAFDGCPISGQLFQGSAEYVPHPADIKSLQVEYSFPRAVELRHALVDWFWYHGIHFMVVM